MMKNGGMREDRSRAVLSLRGIPQDARYGQGAEAGVQCQDTGKMDEGTDFQRGEQSAGQRGKNAAEAVRGMQERHAR